MNTETTLKILEMVDNAKATYRKTHDIEISFSEIATAQLIAEEAGKKFLEWIYEEEKRAKAKLEAEREAEKVSNAFYQIELSEVRSVYSGKTGCMCGCNGNYRYASKYREEEGKRRGYEIDDDEISERSIKIQVNKMNKRLANLTENEFIFGYADTEKSEFDPEGIEYVYFEEYGRCACIFLERKNK